MAAAKGARLTRRDLEARAKRIHEGKVRFLEANAYRMQEYMQMQLDGSLNHLGARTEGGAWFQTAETAAKQMEAAAVLLREGMPRTTLEVSERLCAAPISYVSTLIS